MLDGPLKGYRLLSAESCQTEILYQENFLSAEDCAALVRSLDGDQPRHDGTASLADDQLRGSIIHAARTRATEQLKRFYRVDEALYSQSVQLMRSAPRDARPLQGVAGRPAPVSDTEFISIIYLNDDFVGGYLYFDTLKLAVAPKKGLLVGFRSDALFRDTVATVRTGVSCVMASSYRLDLGAQRTEGEAELVEIREAGQESAAPPSSLLPAGARAVGTRLRCVALSPSPPRLVPAEPLRQWMDDFPGRHAYRCLPMAIANTYGWEILSPCTFSIDWNGGADRADISFRALDDFPYLSYFAESNFSRGVVTFHTGYLFRTDPGWNLLATGPYNRPKHGIAPLTGVIETDWLPYPFTMNWQLTQRGSVTFEKDEPFCLVYPVLHGALEATTPEIFAFEDDLELKAEYDAWRDKRAEFRQRLDQQEPEAIKEAWQRFYFKGEMPSGGSTEASHKIKLRLRSPLDRRK
jgi:hypothetical protein